jgi:type II secretory pathway component GspD/PulD (secretin)
MLVALWVCLLAVEAVIAETPGTPRADLDKALESRLPELEFRNEPVSNVLLVIGDVAGISIVPDETVSGQVSQITRGMTAGEVLEVLAARHGLLWWADGRVVHVSRVRVQIRGREGLLDVEAVGAPLPAVMRRIAAVSPTPVVSDRLPADRVTFRARSIGIVRLARMLVRRYPRFSVEEDTGHLYVRDTSLRETASVPRTLSVTRTEAGFSARVHGVPLGLALSRLFAVAEREYVLLASPQRQLENLRFSGHGFDELLTRVLAAADAAFDVRDDTYYVFSVDRRQVLEGLERSVRVRLRHLSVDQLERVLPPELARNGGLRFDPEQNTAVVTGRRAQIAAVLRFISEVDRPLEGRGYHRFDLQRADVGEVLSRLPQRFESVPAVQVPGANAFVARLGTEGAEELRAFLRLVDRSREAQVVKLQYIRAEDLLRHLPPEVERSHIHTTPDPRVVMVSGPADARHALRSALKVVDKPVPQIRYQLLVIQYEKGRSVEWSPDMAAGPAKPGDSTVLVGRLGDLLALDFDVVTSLGYTFAVELSHRISRNEARVLADTTLNGLSGKHVEFQNTNTFRYRDQAPAEDDEDSLGVTREITSGLFVGIEGWSSGDDMITMDISATLSRRGNDVSADGTNPPPTSERIVDTQVRTPSGKPVVIGGLIQQDVTENTRKMPLLASVPLLGRLFRSTARSLEETELALYVLPVVEHPGEPESVTQRLEGYLERLVEVEQ